jgi:L-lactate dehydrogenase complex protein LldG
MNDQRAQVLQQIRASLQSAHLPNARASIPPRAAVGQGDRAEMAARFQRELEPLGGTSYVTQNANETITLILNLLRDAGGQEILAWDDADLPVRGLGQALSENGYTRIASHVPANAEGRKAKLAELERAVVGITGAFAGLADTGTLALVSEPVRPRMNSLLPPTHVALLPTSRLYPTMAAFFAAHPDVTQRGSNLVFITGPSRTADIELTLTRGVHGPKFLHVILLDWL